MLINIEAGNLSADILYKRGIAPVGELKNLARLGASEYVIAVGGQTCDVLIQEIASALQRHVDHVDAMNTLVCSSPDIVAITFYHTVYSQLSCRNQVLLKTITVQAQLIESNVIIGNQNIACRGDVGLEKVVDVEIIMVADSFQRVFYAVGLTVDDEDASVVHFQPDVLGEVDDHVVNTVVKTSYTTGNTRFVVIEMITIETGNTIPCG